MKYRRVLLIAPLEADAQATLAMLRRVAPQAETLLVVAVLPARHFGWLSDAAPPDLQREATDALDRLRNAAAGAAASVELTLLPALGTEALDAQVAASACELIVVGALPLGDLAVVAALRGRRSLAVLWVPETNAPRGTAPVTELVCVAIGRRARIAVTAFLRDHVEAAQRVTVLLVGGTVPHGLAAAVEVAGVRAAVEFVAPQGLSSQQWLDQRMRARPPDLLVYARLPSALWLGARWPVPSLLLPPPAPLAHTALQRDIDAPDLADVGGPLRLRVDHAAGLGRRTPVPDQELAIVVAGRVVARVGTRMGWAELPAGLAADSLGLFRTEVHDAARPLAAVELRVRVLRPGTAPLLLFDAALPDPSLAALRTLAGAPAPELLAVRLRPMQSCRAIRSHLRDAGLAARVLDASVVLDEGAALDVPEAVDAVRLARVAAQLRAAGFPVGAIVHQAPTAPATHGFVAVHADEIGSARWHAPIPVAQPASLADRLEITTATPRIEGNRVELELDNATARRWLLDAIADAQARIHLQVYMATDDALGRRVETALAQAAARGVRVRVLVDSLHGLHGSLGASNPLLERLAARPGIELRVARPITALPSLADLKLRDHRKLVVADNRVALVGGRNLAHEYYTGFDEVALSAGSMWREVPWLDAGARIEGPAVAALERSFLGAWAEAGGDGFGIESPAAAGPTPLRVVIHQGLRDAATLEAYLALIETAVSRIDVVNGFPLILEIQHALLRALRRGVRVRTLFGHLTPMHGDQPFGGPWASARNAATALVHSRMDTLVEAGAEGYQFTVAAQPSWAPGLGPLRSHVHAKLMCADGRVCAVGSANMDITGGYWESELLLVVEDAAVSGSIQARIDALIAASSRVDRDDAQWQQSASWRRWMHHWPSLLSM